MNTALWALQSIYAIIFVTAGLLKITVHKDKLKQMGVAGLEELSARFIHLIGISEVLGAIGLIFPLLFGVIPWLTSISALGLGLIMVSASYVHYKRNEYSNISVNITILLCCILIAYFRW